MEEIYKKINNFGRNQKIITIVCGILSVFTSIYTATVAYLTRVPEFLCKDNNNENLFKCKYKDDVCSNKFVIIKNKLKSLDNWSFKYNLYCDKEYYSSVISSSHFIGASLGSILLAKLPDKYGRKKIFLILTILNNFLFLNFLFVINTSHILLIEFFGGFANFGCSMVYYILAELIPNEMLGKVCGIINASYPLLGVLLGLYFVTINKYYLLFIILFIIHLIVSYYTIKYFVESPRWLLTNKLYNDLKDSLYSLAKVNNTENELTNYLSNNPNILINKTENDLTEKIKEKKYTIIELFNLKSQRKKIILVSLIWFGTSLTNLGFTVNLGNLKGNFYLNSIMAYIGMFIGRLISGYFCDYFGRVFVLKYSSYLGTISLFVFVLIKNDIGKSIFIFISTLGFSSSYNGVTIYSPESFPTKIRGTVSSIFNLLSKLSPLLIPPLSSLIGLNFSLILIGALTAFVCYFLEETLGKEMENDIPEEIEKQQFLEQL